jgi:hypothetical protein
MSKYVVQIDGQNFLVDFEGNVAKRGFITFRCVEAPDVHSAEYAAVQLLRDDQDLRAVVKNESSDPPVMNVIEVNEVESFDDMESHNALIWYDVTPKRWWQFWRH